MDRKGEVLETATRHNLIIVNKQNSPPMFKTNRAKGWIDLTIVNKTLYPLIQEWEVVKDIKYGDHRYVITVIKEMMQPIKYHVTKKANIKILNALTEDP